MQDRDTPLADPLNGNYELPLVMTTHVLHAGDGYLYLIRSVAVHDGGRVPGRSMAAYYTASGQPPGRWSGTVGWELKVGGTITEGQMQALFGEGLHPNAVVLRDALMREGKTAEEVPHFHDTTSLAPIVSKGRRSGVR